MEHGMGEVIDEGEVEEGVGTNPYKLAQGCG